MSAKDQGRTSHLNGVSAEDQVARAYQRIGARVLHRRWRGTSGEIDLICDSGGEIIIVEVKARKGHNAALASLSQNQISRICQSAEEYLQTLPLGSLTPMRLDVACVDSTGEVKILQNALLSG